MSLPKWREEAIAKHHNRKAFDCGEPTLNEYLRRYARQNHTSGGAKTFVAVPFDEPVHVLGYYSLSPAEVSIDRVPERVRQGRGRYPLPGFRLARPSPEITRAKGWVGNYSFPPESAAPPPGAFGIAVYGQGTDFFWV